MSSEVLTEIKLFLNNVLVKEQLSITAEKERIRLLQRLEPREYSPAPYLEMTCPSPPNKDSNTNENSPNGNTIQCYEELSDTRSSITSYESINEKNKIPNDNNLYYNIPEVIRYSSCWDVNNDVKPSIPVKETRSCENSAATSARNSICSLPTIISGRCTGSESDAISEASSSASTSSNGNNFVFNNNNNNNNNSINNFKSLSNSNSNITNGTRSCLSRSSPEVITVSASALRYSASKYGILSRKEKFLFLDHYKHYWVGILGHVLYIYSSDKDSKPILEIDVTNYQARPVGVGIPNTKKYSSFEIFSPGNKTYQFTATSASEMDQWIAAVCQAGKGERQFLQAFLPSNAEEATNTYATPKTPFKPPPSTDCSTRQLPSIPAEQLLMYDHPDSLARPVTPNLPEQYEVMSSPANSETDTFYHYIDNETGDEHKCALYKNLEGMPYREKEWPDDFDDNDDNLYYNLISTNEDEGIYDTIPGTTEQKIEQQSELMLGQQHEQQQQQLQLEQDIGEMQKKMKANEEEQDQQQEDLSHPLQEQNKQQSQLESRTVPVSGRIQQIIQKIEEAAGTATKTPKTVQDEFYEPVDTRAKEAPTRTVSR